MLSTLAFAALFVVAQQPLPPGASSTLPAGHPPIDGAPVTPPADGAERPSTVLELVRSLDASPELRTQDRPFELSMSIGALYLSVGRPSDALFFFEQASAKAEPARGRWLALRHRAAPHPTAEDVGCARTAGTTLDALLAKSTAKGASLPEQYLCARVAASAAVEADCQVARTKALLRDFDGAFAAFERAIAVEPGSVEARYGRGALRFDRSPDDVAALALAKADLAYVVEHGAAFPRLAQAKRLLERATLAHAAGGASRLPLTQGPAPIYLATSLGPSGDGGAPPGRPPELARGLAGPGAEPVQGPALAAAGGAGAAGAAASPPPLAPEVMEAFSKQAASPEALREVERLIDTGEAALARGEHQAALEAFRSGMPFAPTNGRLRAGLAWALDRLSKPTAERIWAVALEDPASIARLSDVLAERGDAAGAEALRRKLVAAVPSYAARYPNAGR